MSGSLREIFSCQKIDKTLKYVHLVISNLSMLIPAWITHATGSTHFIDFSKFINLHFFQARGTSCNKSQKKCCRSMLTLFSNFAKRSVMATESELTVSQLVVLLTRLSFSHVPALAGTSVNIA